MTANAQSSKIGFSFSHFTQSSISIAIIFISEPRTNPIPNCSSRHGGPELISISENEVQVAGSVDDAGEPSTRTGSFFLPPIDFHKIVCGIAFNSAGIFSKIGGIIEFLDIKIFFLQKEAFPLSFDSNQFPPLKLENQTVHLIDRQIRAQSSEAPHS